MNIELKCRNLFWEIKGATQEFKDSGKNNFSEINSGVEELIDGGESCLKMISNKRKLTKEEFYEMLLKFAYIQRWNEYDCYSVLELVHNLKFVNDGIIKTTMCTNRLRSEGHGRNFDWWSEETGVNFKILYTKEFKIDYEHFYTIEEIKKLIEEKKIVIINEIERNLDYEKEFYKETYQIFDTAFNDFTINHDFFDKTGKYYPYTLKFIKSKTNKKKLLKLFKEHLEHTNEEIYETTHKNCYNDELYKKVVDEYNKEFINKGYAKRLEKLNEFL